MKCPRCGREMAMGAPHDEGDAFQWECRCGYIKPVARGEERE
jgi:ribosomal protein S27AE